MAVILAGIEKLNPKLNAFCTITYDSAMAESQQADEKIVKKKGEGPLLGLPVSIKDLVFTKGIRITFASKMHENFIPDQDEAIVERLKAAGAIIIGKTNSCEYGYKAVTESPLWGITLHKPSLLLDQHVLCMFHTDSERPTVSGNRITSP